MLLARRNKIIKKNNPRAFCLDLTIEEGTHTHTHDENLETTWWDESGDLSICNNTRTHRVVRMSAHTHTHTHTHTYIPIQANGNKERGRERESKKRSKLNKRTRQGALFNQPKKRSASGSTNRTSGQPLIRRIKMSRISQAVGAHKKD